MDPKLSSFSIDIHPYLIFEFILDLKLRDTFQEASADQFIKHWMNFKDEVKSDYPEIHNWLVLWIDWEV
jgi:hypothetical protein